MIISSPIITDYIVPVHPAEKPEDYFQIHKIHLIEILETSELIHTKSTPTQKQCPLLCFKMTGFSLILKLLPVFRRVKHWQLSAPRWYLGEQEETALFTRKAKFVIRLSEAPVAMTRLKLRKNRKRRQIFEGLRILPVLGAVSFYPRVWGMLQGPLW